MGKELKFNKVSSLPAASAALAGNIYFNETDRTINICTGTGYSTYNGNNTWRPLGTGAEQAAAGNHTHTFASLTSKPTTLVGYGITDAAAKNHSHSYLPLSGGTITGDLYVNTNLYGPAVGSNPRNRYDSGLYFFNCNNSTTSAYNFGLYQWNDEFQFTFRTSSDNSYKGSAFTIQGNDGQVAFTKTPKAGSTPVSLEGHGHTGTEVKLTGYSKASSYSAIAASDTVNQAIGKLEGALSGLEQLLASI